MKPKTIAAPGQVITDVQYGTAPDTANRQQSLLMDIYLPAGATGEQKYPLLLMIHGGGFNEGDKKEMASHCALLADSGYIGVSINYRLGWAGNSKKCEGDTISEYYALYRAVQDANAALRFWFLNKTIIILIPAGYLLVAAVRVLPLRCTLNTCRQLWQSKLFLMNGNSLVT